jgi:CubicO group peptidase (beta-lactamase class C family)
VVRVTRTRMLPRRIAVTLAVCATTLVFTGCATAAPPAPVEPAVLPEPAPPAPDQRLTLSDEQLAEIVDPTLPGCSAAVGTRGEVLWAGAAGLADLTAGTPVTPETRFDMGSVAKQFTATAILLLQREGALSLADPVGAHIDGLPAWGRTVTLDQLMHHTSRVRDYWVALDAEGLGFSDPADHDHIIRAIARLHSLSPGTGYEYSNSNYVLLAEVVHRVSGVPLPQYLDERMFTPLGLDMRLAPSLVAADVALSYDAELTFQPPGWTAYGAIGIYTTPSELVRWGDQYRAGDIIGDDFAVGASAQETGELYAAGIDIEPNGDLTHTGRFGGYVSTFTVTADREMTIAVMCNGHASPRFPLTDALREIWAPLPTGSGGTDASGD